MPIDYIYYYFVLLAGVCAILAPAGILASAAIFTIIQKIKSKRD